ncbi:hypothetical protein ABZ471_36590 [Streptomyces sp. NPDC005728]
MDGRGVTLEDRDVVAVRADPLSASDAALASPVTVISPAPAGG